MSEVPPAGFDQQIIDTYFGLLGKCALLKKRKAIDSPAGGERVAERRTLKKSFLILHNFLGLPSSRALFAFCKRLSDCLNGKD